MTDKRYIDELTMAYIHSYDKAIDEIKNPTFATQVAMSVTLVVANIKQQAQQSKIDPFKILIENMMSDPSDQGGGKVEEDDICPDKKEERDGSEQG